MLGDSAGDDAHPRLGIGQLAFRFEQVVDEEPAGVGVGRTFQQSALNGRERTAVLGHDHLDRQSFQGRSEGDDLINEDRVLAARDAARVLLQVATDSHVLALQLLKEIGAVRIPEHREDCLAATDRAHVVGEYLALPARVEEVRPAFRFVLGLHESRVHQHADGLHPRRNRIGRGRERRPQLRDIRHVTVLCDEVRLLLQLYRRFAMKLDVGDIALRCLLGANALRHFARACVELLDLDAVFLLERRNDRLPVGRAELGMIDRDGTFLLRGGDHVVPGFGAGAEHAGERRERQRQHRGLQSRMHPRPPVEPDSGIDMSIEIGCSVVSQFAALAHVENAMTDDGRNDVTSPAANPFGRGASRGVAVRHAGDRL